MSREAPNRFFDSSFHYSSKWIKERFSILGKEITRETIKQVNWDDYGSDDEEWFLNTDEGV